MKINKSDKKNFCLFCRIRISMQKAFCCSKCKDLHFESLKIQIPKLFTKRLAQHVKTKEQIEIECKRYAQMHNYDEKLTIEKIMRILEEDYKIKL